MRVEADLFALVFGESVLNDAVAIVLSRFFSNLTISLFYLTKTGKGLGGGGQAWWFNNLKRLTSDEKKHFPSLKKFDYEFMIEMLSAFYLMRRKK